MWVPAEVSENQQRAEQVALFPLGHLPHIQHHNPETWVVRPGEYLRLCPILLTGVLRGVGKPEMKEQIKAKKKK